jgi:hypothetical protein
MLKPSWVISCVNVELKTNISEISIVRDDMVDDLIKKNSVACSPQANYTDRAAAACWRS